MRTNAPAPRHSHRRIAWGHSESTETPSTLSRENCVLRSTLTKRSAKPKPLLISDRLPPPPPVEPLVLRPAAAAYALSVSERTLWSLISRGRLKVSRIGNCTACVSMESIRRLLAESAGDAT